MKKSRTKAKKPAKVPTAHVPPPTFTRPLEFPKTNPTHSADEVNARIALALRRDHEERTRPIAEGEERFSRHEGITWIEDDSAFDP